MKHVIILATAALALAGCQKSIAQQFNDMCKYQKENDPAIWAESEYACNNPQVVPDDAKTTMVNAYAEMRRLREKVGQ